MPWADLSDSLDTLSGLALQLQHLVATVIAHPVWAVGGVVLAIVFLQIVADLIKRFLKAGLTFALKSPLTISQWLWQRITAPTQPDTSDRIAHLLERLEQLNQEQTEVSTELKSLLSLGHRTERQTAYKDLNAASAEKSIEPQSSAQSEALLSPKPEV